MSNLEAIVDFLESKGLNPNVVAGIVGNLQVESSLNPAAYNAHEGAIGLAQWEGGRRASLQQFAAERGTTEGDLTTQLQFLWHELSGDHEMLQKLQQSGSVSDAAALFDQLFERSAGTSRDQRIAYAQEYANTGQITGAVADSSPAPAAAPAGSTGAAAPTAPAKPTREQFESALGTVGAILSKIPELKGLLDQAVQGGWTVARLQNAVDNSQWYKTNGANARTTIITKLSDPATYTQDQYNKQAEVTALAGQLGVKLLPSDIHDIALAASMKGWSSDQLQTAVGKYWSLHSAAGTPMGQAAALQDQLSQTAHSYGIPLSANSLDKWTQQVISGSTTADTFTEYAKQTAKSMYPGLASLIDAGSDVKTIADPYVQTQAQLLEIDPNSIDWTKDPSIKQALQGSPGSDPKSGPTTMPLWQYEQQVKSDPRWQYTQNAHQATSQMLMQLGKDWGFEA